ncbi:uncharacterized protein PFL1_05571 [Pseudozyma flocculosa PF-1]|uniref:Nudix hydrolase domain-containing protein n=2 Tax=Pseudozyma flocculosa TaxID=84751 RepID=A0A5C3FBY6_9BASI|nr:uncharacterized protein PFL1_05571 [Pseudozyma flocculosa PF-1]EPQ26937.1 hypothetical protein PFL1_05571 [Pseudozyma flocculosa PF-1]SPO41155.1 uncharacterized protein PSFLO_06637 [Pseudozyma flocculosa]
MRRRYTGTRLPPFDWAFRPESDRDDLGITVHDDAKPTVSTGCEIHADAAGHARLGDGRKVYTLVFPVTTTASAPSHGPIDPAAHHQPHLGSRRAGAVDLLLGHKLRGFGAGGSNGFGGKVEPALDRADDALGTIRNAAVRELREECGLDQPTIDAASSSSCSSSISGDGSALDLCGTVDISVDQGERIRIFVFLDRVPASLASSIIATDEMLPRWYRLALPAATSCPATVIAPSAAEATAHATATTVTTTPSETIPLDADREPFSRMRPEACLFLALVLDRHAERPAAGSQTNAPAPRRQLFEVDVRYHREEAGDMSRKIAAWSVLV